MQDLIEGKAIEVAYTDDVLIRGVCRGADWDKEVIHILMPDMGMVFKSVEEIEWDD
jgi:hypothetical protein